MLVKHKPITSETMVRLYSFLAQKGVKKKMIDEIREALVYDAYNQADFIAQDRFYTAFALALHKDFGFGQKRIARVMTRMSGYLNACTCGEQKWFALMEELADETGIVFRADGGNRDRVLVEYVPERKRIKEERII